MVVLLLLLRAAAHPQLSAHLFDGQLLWGKVLSVQAQGEAVPTPFELLEGDGLEAPCQARGVVDLLEDPLVKPLHVLHALPHLLDVADHLLLHVEEERLHFGPQAANGPAQVQERPHGDGSWLEDAGAQHPAGGGGGGGVGFGRSA